MVGEYSDATMKLKSRYNICETKNTKCEAHILNNSTASYVVLTTK